MNLHIMIKATTFLSLMWFQVVIMIDFYTEHEWARFQAINRFSCPSAISESTLSAHIEFSWGQLWCCVCRLSCLCWCMWLVCVCMAPRTASLEYKLTHTEEAKERSQLLLMLHILSCLNSTTHHELFLLSKMALLPVPACTGESIHTVASIPPVGQCGRKFRPFMKHSVKFLKEQMEEVKIKLNLSLKLLQYSLSFSDINHILLFLDTCQVINARKL